ncbi:MAG: ATP-dependent RNA helicase dbp6 [Bogoriella megaspora]|nr:MAG: ATP-dependent RNA helicase dbp6 [Bogoriella megaspora]
MFYSRYIPPSLPTVENSNEEEVEQEDEQREQKTDETVDLHGNVKTFSTLPYFSEANIHSKGLEPLPQPEPTDEPEYQPTFSTLPSWMSQRISVPSTARKPFADMRLEQRTVETLEKQGYTDALAVQSAIIPMLLSLSSQHRSDLCVAASTGSGKTLAYTVPMVEALKTWPATKLRGIIIVPTRELVMQVRKVAEQCISGTRLKIGTAIGSNSLSTEQSALITKGRQFDPARYKDLQHKADRRLLYGDVDVEENVEMLEDAVRMLPNHVPVYSSSVDILICTPGRLVNHIESTNGFSLDDLEWLVIDEIDRLLDANFQEWIDIVMNALDQRKPTAHDRLLASLYLPPEPRRVQKILLSATMTRDVSKLGALKLRRPKMVVVEGVETTNDSLDPTGLRGYQADELPMTLREYAVPVEDELEKPLYLLRLLESTILPKSNDQKEDSIAESSSDEFGPTSKQRLDVDMEPMDDDMGLPDDLDSGSLGVKSPEPMDTHKPVTQSLFQKETDSSGLDNVLIFTNSNENASRLSSLLAILNPEYADLTGTLTKSTATSANKKVIKAFHQGKISILIASDRASRGLDLPHLANVVNYDMPKSITSYIHRVGRTARAGRAGSAWTFYTSSEARWFFNAIARSAEIARRHEVVRKRQNTADISENLRAEYQKALESLKRKVEGSS